MTDLSVRSASSGRQVRSFTGELRASDDGSGGTKSTFTGYASITGRSYEMNDAAGSYPETVHPGAFRGTLAKNPDVQWLLNHGGEPFARSGTSDTMKLSEDSTGLHVEANLNAEHPLFRYVTSALDRRDLNEMSFAFRILDPQSGWNEEYTERNITQVDLNRGDVSLVNYGASPHTADYPAMRSPADFDALSDDEARVLLGRLQTRLTREAPAAAPVEVLKALGVPVQDLQTYAARAYVLRNAL